MKKTEARIFIARELYQLGVKRRSEAWKVVMEQAMGAWDVLSEKELQGYVADYLENLPNHCFH